MRKRRKKPSRTRRHRESVAAKRRARAFYRTRIKREDEAKAAGRRAWLFDALLATAAIIAATVAWILS